ncbi:hypothetical protein DFH09DRAFT_1093761 [Mycena vulgaris]|nr:hypothetical protein DFH09DRAFT_1093761 [Mycena vulgaris]
MEAQNLCQTWESVCVAVGEGGKEEAEVGSATRKGICPTWSPSDKRLGYEAGVVDASWTIMKLTEVNSYAYVNPRVTEDLKRRRRRVDGSALDIKGTMAVYPCPTGQAAVVTAVGIVTVRPGRRTVPKTAVRLTVRRRYGSGGSLTRLDGTGRWTGRPSDGGRLDRTQ